MVDQPTLPRDIAAIASRERRLFGLSAVISIALVGGAIVFLVYASSTLTRLQSELQTTETALEQTKDELDDSRAALDRIEAQVNVATAERDEAEQAAARYRAEAEAAQSSVSELEAKLAEATAELDKLAEQIRLSLDYRQHLHPVGWDDAKMLYATSDRIGDLFERILRFRDADLGFSIANNPDEGFTSPAFANYVLQELGVPGLSDLRRVSGEPNLGDILLYETGYALFYLTDIERKPFVIGMTPAGIAALEPDFGVPRIGVLRTGLLDQ